MLYDLKLPGLGNRILSWYGTPLPFHATVNSAGHELRRETSYSWDGLKRGRLEFAVWQLTLSGWGRLDYEGTSFTLHPGEAMLVHVPHRHRYYLPPESPDWEFIFITLGGLECLRLCRALEEKNGPVICYGQRTPTLTRAERILAAVAGKRAVLPRISALAYDFCMALVQDAGDTLNCSLPPAVAAAVCYARENFTAPVGVEEMSAAAGLSRYYFTRLFQRHMRISPGDFLFRLRMEKAMRLLQSSAESLPEIAAAAGFQSASYFCRAFRKNYGMTPGTFRNGGQDISSDDSE